MSRVKNRLNELRKQGFATAETLPHGGGGAPPIFFYPAKSRALTGAAAAVAGVAGATWGSTPEPSTSAREKGFASRDFALPYPTAGRSIAIPKTGTRTKTTTLQPTAPPRPQRPKRPQRLKRPQKPRISGSSSDSDRRETEGSSVQAPPPKSSIYSRVAQVLRRR